MEEESEEDASVDLPNLKPLQLDKDLKERVLQQLVPVRLQHLDITSGLLLVRFADPLLQWVGEPDESTISKANQIYDGQLTTVPCLSVKQKEVKVDDFGFLR